MAKRKAARYDNPLDWFLNQPGLELTSLASIAKKVRVEPFDADSFRKELTSKLERFQYRSAHSKSEPESGATFNKLLKQADVLERFLDPDTLYHLWKLLLLKQIFERVAELDQKELAVDGISVKEHKKKGNHIYKDIVTLDRINKEYGLGISAGYLARMTEMQLDEIGATLTPLVRPEEKESLLTGSLRSRKTKPREIRNEERAIQVNIFRFLQSALQNPSSVMEGISDIFLSQLTELVWCDSTVQRLSNGTALLKFTTRFPVYWT